MKALSRALPSIRIHRIGARQIFHIPPDYTRQKRSISLGTILFPPAVFGGLLISLWTIKSISLVIFQNKVIYMPYLPPYSRNDPIPPPNETSGIEWERALDIVGHRGVKLATCRAVIGRGTLEGKLSGSAQTNSAAGKEIVILYLQGNAGNAPMRLPLVSKHVLDGLQNKVDKLTFVYPSYRGYWLSKGSADPKGMRKDIPYILKALQQYKSPSAKFMIWGESIGSGVAVSTAAEARKNGIHISGLILETPFLDISELVKETYPQRWLPYYYLTPFVKENWSLKEPLLRWWKDTEGQGKVLILTAGNDELVGERLGKETVELIKKQCGENVQALRVDNAGHQDCLGRQSSPIVQNFILTV